MKISSLAQPDRTVNKCGQTALCTQTSGLRNKQIMENGFLIDVDKSMPVQCRKRRPNQKANRRDYESHEASKDCSGIYIKEKCSGCHVKKPNGRKQEKIPIYIYFIYYKIILPHSQR